MRLSTIHQHVNFVHLVGIWNTEMLITWLFYREIEIETQSNIAISYQSS